MIIHSKHTNVYIQKSKQQYACCERPYSLSGHLGS